MTPGTEHPSPVAPRMDAARPPGQGARAMTPAHPHTRRAVLLVLSGTGLFGLIDNFIRLAAETGSLWQFHLLRGGLIVLMLLGLAAGGWMAIRARQPGWVALRALLNSATMVIYFGALGVMPISQALAGLFTAPLFVVIYSLALGERVSPGQAVAVLLGFAGIVLALGLDPTALTAASLLPVLAGALYGAGNLVTRRRCAAEPTGALLLWFFGAMAVWGALGLLALTLHPLPAAAGADGYLTRGWTAPTLTFWAVVVVQAVGSLAGVGAITRAYQEAEPTLVAVLENALLVFATLWAILLFAEWPAPLEALGLLLVTLAATLAAWASRPQAAALAASP